MVWCAMLNTEYGGPPYQFIRRKRRSLILAEATQPNTSNAPTQPKPAEPTATITAGGSDARHSAGQQRADADSDGDHEGQPPVLDEASARPEPIAASGVSDLPDDTEPFQPAAKPAEQTEKGAGNGLDVQGGNRRRTRRQ